MIDADKLVVEECYFLLFFYHPKINIPVIKTYIYMGKDLYKDRKHSKNGWFFQDAKSYVKHGSFLKLPQKIERELLIIDEDILSRMYDINGLIEALIKLKEGKL